MQGGGPLPGTPRRGSRLAGADCSRSLFTHSCAHDSLMALWTRGYSASLSRETANGDTERKNKAVLGPHEAPPALLLSTPGAAVRNYFLSSLELPESSLSW